MPRRYLPSGPELPELRKGETTGETLERKVRREVVANRQISVGVLFFFELGSNRRHLVGFIRVTAFSARCMKLSAVEAASGERAGAGRVQSFPMTTRAAAGGARAPEKGLFNSNPLHPF